VLHFKRRVLRAVPRNVVWSLELRSRTLTSEHRVAVERIARELEEGVDTRPRMTTAIRTAGYNDGLLSDWGIHRLHIGEKPGGDGFFIERDGPLLFIFVVEAVAYLIDLRDHGSFADEDLIEILHRNWPDVLASWIAPGAIPGRCRRNSRPPSARPRARGSMFPPRPGTERSTYRPEVASC